jgi:hypothetical protein
MTITNLAERRLFCVLPGVRRSSDPAGSDDHKGGFRCQS